MSKKVTTQDFIDRAHAIHGDKYGYAISVYQGTHTKLMIHCHEHGVFKQTPNNHLRGRGCPSCKAELVSSMFKSDLNSFVVKSKKIHGEKYDYSSVVYVDAKTKVFIRCMTHGIFQQTPDSHICQKSGCPTCSINERSKNNTHTVCDFIMDATSLHGDKYDYSLVHYVNAKTKIKINCHEHGVFEQTPFNHLSGRGCPKCADKIRADAKRYDTDSFIAKAHTVHGNIYGYGKIKYTDSISKVIIVCSEHGDFEQIASAHISGQGCPGCAKYGFDRTRSASLYVLRSDCGRYMKIGITHNPKQRYNKLKRDTPFSFKRIELIEGPGEQIANLEKELLAEYRPAEFTETFDGYSEWRLWSESIRHKLISFMNKELTNGPL